MRTDFTGLVIVPAIQEEEWLSCPCSGYRGRLKAARNGPWYELTRGAIPDADYDALVDLPGNPQTWGIDCSEAQSELRGLSYLFLVMNDSGRLRHLDESQLDNEKLSLYIDKSPPE